MTQLPLLAELLPFYLSDNFSYDEATFSKTAVRLGISNIPSPAQLASMRIAALGMEKVRALCGNKVVHVSSWFRHLDLNTAIGSKPTSQHVKGEAIDFNIFRFGTPRQVCERIVAHTILVRFDQLILEDGWVHISFETSKNSTPRSQVLTITPDGKAHSGLIYYK